MHMTVWAPEGLPEIHYGDSIAKALLEAIAPERLADGDIVAVSHKIVSKAEGRVFDPEQVAPSAEALVLSRCTGKPAEQMQVVLNESRRILWARRRGGPVITQHRCGYVCANAGVDMSNAAGRILALPTDPDASAAALRKELEQACGVRLGVVICDTHGRPFREGACGIAVGASGVQALHSYVGHPDRNGRAMETSVECLADEIAAAATLLMGQGDEGLPVAIVRALPRGIGEQCASQIIRPEQSDIFLQALKAN